MGRPFSQWPAAFQSGVQQTTLQDFCAKRVQEGMPQNLCAAQYETWRAVTANKEQKYGRGIAQGV